WSARAGLLGEDCRRCNWKNQEIRKKQLHISHNAPQAGGEKEIGQNYNRRIFNARKPYAGSENAL
ncbi:MAG TPA: hypothetical protein VMV39_05680, partial [Terracidiphilus sp.]|nr:hypothetical protein [Terracidiphilus sp.]